MQRIGDLAGALDFHRLANLLRAKALFIGTMACVTVASAFIYLLWAPRIYESRAVIQVHQEAENVVNLNEVSKRETGKRGLSEHRCAGLQQPKAHAPGHSINRSR